MAREILKVRHYKVGYEIRTIRLDGKDAIGGPAMTIKTAFTPTGDYIGRSKLAHLLCKKMGIAPETIDDTRTVCSVGFCEEKQRWYGWSHRAITGFGIGDRIFEEQYGDERTPFVKHGERVIATMDDARLAAVAFAKSVS